MFPVPGSFQGLADVPERVRDSTTQTAGSSLAADRAASVWSVCRSLGGTFEGDAGVCLRGGWMPTQSPVPGVFQPGTGSMFIHGSDVVSRVMAPGPVPIPRALWLVVESVVTFPLGAAPVLGLEIHLVYVIV